MSNWGNSLPDVVLDILLGRILPVEDVRSFHQVCKTWSKAVESRPKVNERRRDLVNRTYIDKENSEQNSVLDIRTNSGKPEDGKDSEAKPGSRQSICRSVLRSSASSNASSNRSSSQATPKISSNRSTPKSRYHIQLEAARKLKDGEVLSPCPECRSPVPSPSPNRHSHARVRLISLQDLKEEPETPESTISSNNRVIQYLQCQCPTCSYRFCSRCKFKEHTGKPCREIDCESGFFNESDRLRNSKTSNLRSGKLLNRRKRNPNLKRTLL